MREVREEEEEEDDDDDGDEETCDAEYVGKETVEE